MIGKITSKNTNLAKTYKSKNTTTEDSKEWHKLCKENPDIRKNSLPLKHYQTKKSKYILTCLNSTNKDIYPSQLNESKDEAKPTTIDIIVSSKHLNTHKNKNFKSNSFQDNIKNKNPLHKTT